MNDTDVLFLCLDLGLSLVLHKAYIAPCAKSWHVVRALLMLVGFVTVTLSLLAVARLLGEFEWWSISSTYVMLFMIVQARMFKMIKECKNAV